MSATKLKKLLKVAEASVPYLVELEQARHSGESRNPAPLVRLREVAEINPRRLSNPPSDDDLVSFIPMKAVEEENGRLNASGTRPWRDVKKGYTPFQEGDVIFAKITPCMENGKYALAIGLHDKRAAGSTEFHVFRPGPNLDARYLLHFLFTPELRSRAKLKMQGAAGQLRVTTKFFDDVEIPLPPLEKQRRIVAEIEKQFTRLEAGIAALRRVQANLKRYRAAVLKAACEGRLVPTEAELARKKRRTYETGEQLLARILVERRQRWTGRGIYKEPATPDTVNLPSLPDGWTWVTISQASSTIVDCPHSTAKFVADGLPCVDTTCIKPGRIVRDKLRYVSAKTYEERVKRLVPAAGDIIFAREGTVGTAVVIPEDVKPCLGQRVMLMRSDACIMPRYFEHCLNSESVRTQYLPKIVGSTAPHLNVAEVKLLSLPLAPLAEQERIVAEIERLSSVAEEQESMVTANLQRATRLRLSILYQAFASGLNATCP